MGTDPQSTAHRAASALLLVAMVSGGSILGGLLVGCSGADDGANDAEDAHRQLDLTHEPCDVESSGAQRTDVNNDGKADIVRVMAGGKEICRSVDLNFDGRVDMYVYYDETGTERRREADFDRDGRADEISTFKGGVVTRKDRETNFDGKLDTWDFYEGGRLVRRERDANGDGSVDQWWTFNNPVDPNCAVVTADTNQDGKPDPGTEVDLCAPEGTSNLPPVPPAPGASASASASAAPSASIPTPPPPPPLAPSAPPTTSSAPSATPAPSAAPPPAPKPAGK